MFIAAGVVRLTASPSLIVIEHRVSVIPGPVALIPLIRATYPGEYRVVPEEVSNVL